MRSMPPAHAETLSGIRSDQRERWQRGERVPVEDYLHQRPQLAGDSEALLELIRAEVLLRREVGEVPTLDEYLGRFPALADALRQHWPTPPFGASPSAQTHTDAYAPADEVTVPRAPAAPANVRIPGFVVLDKLGEGGMGVVYRARQPDLDRVVALKLLPAGPLAGEHLLSRFHVEQKAVARLDHPGVVRIHSTGQHEGCVFFCMEFVPGGSLADRLRHGPLDVRQAAEVVRQLALAVQHAHEAGVIHRDLKPANVLIAEDGRPKVSDFGLAKLLDGDDGLTQSGALLGTPSYLAPEQARGEARDVGPAADVYALGAVLYECLTGRPPFRGATRTETLELVKTQPPQPPRRLRPEVPAELEAICLACLEKEPQHRPASAAALAADLAAWLSGKPARIRPVRGWRRLMRGASRRPFVLTAALLMLLVLSAGGIVALAFPGWRPWAKEQTPDGPGKPPGIELIGATGKPANARWWKADKDAKFVLDAEGACAIDALPLTLVELLPDTGGSRHYSIHAQIRHHRAAKGGYVGLYFAGTTNRTAKEPVLSFLQMRFNDREDEVENYKRLPPQFQKPALIPSGNRVVFTARHFADGKPEPLLDCPAGLDDPHWFVASKLDKPAPWRNVRIDVSPERVELFCVLPDQPAIDMPITKIEQASQAALAAEFRNKAVKEALKGFVATLDLRGSVGLVLKDSHASFRNVRFEPHDLPGTD